MPGFPSGLPPLDHHDDGTSISEGSDAAEEVMDMELIWDLSEGPELNEEEMQRGDGGWSQDGDLCGQLERRWLLWHQFMKEHAHLDTWLQLAEQAVAFPNPAHVTYATAKEELRKFERLRRESGSRLVELDSLTRRNRTLTRLFRGTMRSRLLALVRACGQRWDEVNTKLESTAARLKGFVSDWEGFEAEREELALWLADLDVRLTEVDHLTGNTCEKLRRLQSFQECVCVNSARVNALLRRGETLIQGSESSDAQHVETQLVELLRRCSLIYNNIGRTHTRLLTMRLVFEDDFLSQAPDSGCPSESVLEDEGALDKAHLDPPALLEPPEESPSRLRLPPPPPCSPTHEHLGLEWDPSVDIGRSISRDDADSSYFSASTGVCHGDGMKRWSYLSSISDDNQEVDLRSDGWLGQAHPSVFAPVEAQWMTSTPGRQDKLASFDGGRVRAWLGVQSPTPQEERTSCSKAVQTEEEVKTDDPTFQRYLDRSQNLHDNKLSHDQDASPDWVKQQQCHSDLQFRLNPPPSNRGCAVQAEEEESCCEEDEGLFSKQSVASRSRDSSRLFSTALLCFLLAAALALLACVMWVTLEPPCHRSGKLHRSFHLMLTHVNGPPPT